MYHCNIRFPCKIKKVIKNIYINIIGHDKKKLWNEDVFVKTMQMDKDMRKNGKHPVKREAHGLRCEYKEWENMRCFRNPIIVSNSVLCNILYGIVKWFSFIHGCRHLVEPC